MNKNFTKLFSNFNSPEPPSDLLNKVIRRIRDEQQRQTVKQRLIVFSLGIICSILAAIPAFQMVRTEIAASGLKEFLSLMLTDSEIITVYWQNFILIILESLPVMSLAVLLAAVFAFLESLKLLTRDLKNLAPSNK